MTRGHFVQLYKNKVKISRIQALSSSFNDIIHPLANKGAEVTCQSSSTVSNQYHDDQKNEQLNNQVDATNTR